MNLTIYKVPNKILSKKTEEISNVKSGFINLLCKNMLNLLKNKNNGYAVTANQVGHSLSLFVLNSYNDSISELMKQYNIVQPYVINPIILSYEGEIDSPEGCLSIPDKSFVVKRYEKISVSFIDLNSTVYEIQLTGLLSVIFQHEIDHLNGVSINEKS